MRPPLIWSQGSGSESSAKEIGKRHDLYTDLDTKFSCTFERKKLASQIRTEKKNVKKHKDKEHVKFNSCVMVSLGSGSGSIVPMTLSAMKKNSWSGPESAQKPMEVQNQCCGSGSGIRCLFDPWIRDRLGKKSRSGSRIRIRDEHPGSYFREFRNNFLG
jgi:hypothetical protein